jgi:hypothetical protein
MRGRLSNAAVRSGHVDGLVGGEGYREVFLSSVFASGEEQEYEKHGGGELHGFFRYLAAMNFGACWWSNRVKISIEMPEARGKGSKMPLKTSAY